MMKYFLSDLHFYDEGLMKYCDRPFSSVEEMHCKIIDNFRNKVGGNGEIYILGDITGKNSMNLTKINYMQVLDQMGISNSNTPFHLILGNNDKLPAEDYMDMGFVSVKGIDNIQIGEFKAMLTHDPCMVQQVNTLALCGHVHTLFDYVYNVQRNTLAINVGIEVRDYTPVSEDEIIALIKNTNYNAQ
ncbi:MAG: metallophosphoesterase family protein [Synergistaceae bacterium]|nr:metallophosphoesterase family protein [Synergistaceae bacterium]